MFVDFEMTRDPVSVGRARTWFWRDSRADAGWSREKESRAGGREEREVVFGYGCRVTGKQADAVRLVDGMRG